MRGLKYIDNGVFTKSLQSHPTRVRGLKFEVYEPEKVEKEVAPYTGAWIEIILSQYGLGAKESHPTRVRGLKLAVLNS